MTWFTENPTPPVVLGIVIEAVLVIVLMKTGSRRVLGGIVLTALATIAVVAANLLIVTPREQVTATLEEIRLLVEANDRPELVKRLDPSAVKLRNQVQYDLASIVVERARIDDLKVVVDASGTTARVEFDGLVVVREAMGRPLPLRFAVDLKKVDDRWLVTDAEYVLQKGLGGDASNAPTARAVSDGIG